ncbi:hypothetical protein M431DRAFT_502596 [Trichoderma harzianum CBS 226.95]|uniref:Uncharacterized protein n=1 Tax=Trichoderma harzianum CBS 226.95 TaxID=983964 RepID=A0A2T4ATR1_TRIHA|nr:hypothetical protein M431DRAFT_502596 [Trichoderma harzianum CBS 226.95]PTB60457.1 hypothetical protein M431DRAFT_502596 [Trichoderma harzianum CBS 226.95]
MDFVRTSSRSGPNKPALDLVSVRPAFALREIRCSPVGKKHPTLQLPSPSSRPVHQSADVEGSTSSPKPSHLIPLTRCSALSSAVVQVPIRKHPQLAFSSDLFLLLAQMSGLVPPQRFDPRTQRHIQTSYVKNRISKTLD